MTTKTETTLRKLNRLYRILGTWQAVANEIGVNRATVNKWFAGTKGISPRSQEIVSLTLDVLV